MVGVSIITFILLRVLPGDPAVLMAGQGASPEQIAAIRTDLGLDAAIFPVTVNSTVPFVELHGENQFFNWVGDLSRGDLGKRFYDKSDVLSQVKRRFPASAQLVLMSLTVSVIVGVSFGVISAVMRNSPLDYFVRIFAVFGQSIPDFFLLILLIVIPSILWNYAQPPGGYVSPMTDLWRNLELFGPPSLILGFAGAAGIMRLQRTTMLEVLRSDFVRTARAKGMAGPSVIMNHAFRNTLAPLITVIGTSFTLIFGGSVIAERILGIEGLGVFFLESAIQRDFPVVQFLVIYTATVVVIANLIVDLSYAYIDPRVRYR